ncbi:MAG: M3 family oligoendopeptidase [Meiothermus sp.]|nr:M3 family oligoendopeptidase [Meiothermus sp.]
MSNATLELPAWDLDPIFPGLESPQFARAWEAVKVHLGELKAFCSELKSSDFPELVNKLNSFGEDATPVYAYLYLLTSVNSLDTAAQAKLSEMQIMFLEYQKLRPRLNTFFASLEPGSAGEYRILVEEARVKARHQMSEPEEVLAAELALSGSTGWVKLHDNLTSQILVTVGGQELPMPATRNLAADPNEAVRKSAYDAELAAWKANQTAIAAALNGYKGSVSTLNRKRGWADDLEPELLANRISRATLGAMQAAMVGSFPHWRRYFGAKAKALGKARLDWWDLFAPLSAPAGHQPMSWDWETGRDFIVKHLATFSKDDAELAERAYAQRWTDAPPRRGKQGGAYCLGVGRGLSRILTNYQPNFDAVTTMAHELGHAYHNHCLRDAPYLLRTEPMTLAETASIMNETVVGEAAMEVLPPADQLVVLEGGLQNAGQVIVDIHSRFLFESKVFARRRERELSPEEFCGLMLDAQQQTYGDGLASYHPYMWAVKGHYYGSNFYNFPYAFGLLFGLALFRRYQQEGPDFVARYDQLLASTGKYSVEELAAQFGFDLESEDFWQGGIDVLVGRIDQFERLVG